MGIKKSSVLTDNIWNSLPIALDRKGSSVFTKDKIFYELSGGSHTNFIVNSNNEIISKLKQRIDTTVLPLNGRKYISNWQELLAEKISVELNDFNSKVYFTSGGTEGIETAVRIALAIQRNLGHPLKNKFITRKYSYHGMSVYTRLIADHNQHSYEDLSNLKKQSNLQLEAPLCSCCPYGLKEDSCNLKCATELERMIIEQGSENIAGLIIEPIGGTTSGALKPPKGYLEKLSEICRKYNVLFIADEVISSFYRAGRIFWTENINIDIRVGGKCLSGGYGPICSVILSGNLIERINGKMTLPLRLTFAGNPLMCLTALSVQETIQELNLLNDFEKKESIINEYLESFCRSNNNYHYRGIGLIWAISIITKGSIPSAIQKYSKYFNKNGLEILMGSISVNNSIHFLFSPALDLLIEELLRDLRIFTDSIKTITE